MERQALYEPFPWLTVRAPALPADARRTTATDDPLFRRALAVGSASLSAALERTPRDAAARARAERKVRRFATRMATRATPYGLFAGVALAQWGARTTLAIADAPPRPRTRPDMGWLFAFVERLEARREVRTRLSFTADSLAAARGGRMVLPHRDGRGDFVSVRATSAVLRTLAAARSPRAYDAIVSELLAHVAGATEEKADRLIAELTSLGFLVSNLRPPLLGDNPAAHVARQVSAIPDAADEASRLTELMRAAAAFDAAPPHEAVAAYARVTDAGATDAASPSAGPCVQVDGALCLAGCALSPAIGDEAARVATLLLQLTPSPPQAAMLNAYRAAFAERYTGREVPLIELLDADAGLGFPSAFASHPVDAERIQRRNAALLRAAQLALRERRTTWELDDDAIAVLSTWTPRAETLPRTLDLSVLIGAHDAEALDRGDFRLVVGPNLGAPGAGRHLGRFADVLGADATSALREVAAAEEDGRIFAELVYAPADARMMNVAVRPRIREHAIVAGVAPGVDASCVIPVDEIVVGIAEGRMYARWLRDGREIVPCSGHMLNFAQAPPALRFLDLLARDGVAAFLPFSWGPAQAFPALPRVTHGRAVLRAAEWKLDRTDVPDTASAAAFARALREWRERWDCPRDVFLAQGDNRLVLDLDDSADVEDLRAEMRSARSAAQLALQEVVPCLDEAWLRGPRGRYVSEFIVSLQLATPPARRPVLPAGARRTALAVPAAERLRSVGSDWLFVKIYAPRDDHDALIAGPVRELAHEALQRSAAEGWFFVRYADPKPHLRLRFHGDPDRLTRDLLPVVAERLRALMADGRCTSFAFDTYERETERYGGPHAIELAERMFCADSETVAELLERGGGAPDRLVLAAAAIDGVLTALGLDAAERVRWCREDADRRAGSAEYRTHKNALRALLAPLPNALTDDVASATARALLERRAAALAPLGARLTALANAGSLCTPVDSIARSLVHMHCNRIGVADQTAIALLARALHGLQAANRCAA